MNKHRHRPWAAVVTRAEHTHPLTETGPVLGHPDCPVCSPALYAREYARHRGTPQHGWPKVDGFVGPDQTGSIVDRLTEEAEPS